MADKPRNFGASVRDRLRNIARKSGMDFQLLLTRYVLERLLYRLGASDYRDEFILKGAMLCAMWLDPFRNTRDLDLLARREPDAARAVEVFQEICLTVVPNDGVVFDAENVKAVPIRDNGGIRITTVATLGGARVPVRVDIGFGDVVTPVSVDYPALLDLPHPRLMAYPRETVVAEKFEAIVALGLTNSRMKDFHDVALLANSFAFDGQLLTSAVAATFRRRGTSMPAEPPPALSDAFAKRPETVALWRAFVTREAIAEGYSDLEAIVQILRSFLMAPAAAAADGQSFALHWAPRGPWDKNTLSTNRADEGSA